MACAGEGIALHLVAAGANDHDSPLLEPTVAGVPDMIGPLPDQPCLHLDRGYDSAKTRDLLEILSYHREIAVKGHTRLDPSLQALAHGAHPLLDERLSKLRRRTDKRKIIVEFYLYLAAALTGRRLSTPRIPRHGDRMASSGSGDVTVEVAPT